MRQIFRLSFPTVLLLLLLINASSTFAQTSTFTYQGRLTEGGNAASGPYDFQFTLWDALDGGKQLPLETPITLTKNGVVVGNGVFSVQLDFTDAPFRGADCYLEISVKRPADTSFMKLSPRQQLTSTPYAIRSASAAAADVATMATNNVLKGGDTMTGELVLSGNPTTSLSAAPKQYVDNSVASKLSLSGGTMTGDLVLSGNPTTNLGAATKQYVDSSVAPKLSLSGGTMTGPLGMGNNRITSLASPASGTDAANKNYVDAAVSGGGQDFQWQEFFGTTQAVSNRGYIANSAAEVEITLPAAPNFGDIVRVSGAGTGGYRISQNAGQSIVTTGLFSIGQAWIARESARQWQSVASSSDGTKLVAVDSGVGGSGGRIYTSTDSGVTWTPRESNRIWMSVASSHDGTKLVAVVQLGRIYTSTNSGVSWTPRESNRAWRSVASSSDGTKLVAVESLDTASIQGRIYTSTDSGVSWTPRESNRYWVSVASDVDGTKLVAVVAAGQIYTSTDSGVSWTPRDTDRAWGSVASSADGLRLVAVVGAGQIYTSPNSGLAWISRESDRGWRSVASSHDGTKLVAVASSDRIYISTDSGVDWVPRESARSWQSVASSHDGSKLVAVTLGGRIYTSSGSTSPGVSGFLSGTAGSAIELLYVGNGQWLPLSHVGTLTPF